MSCLLTNVNPHSTPAYSNHWSRLHWNNICVALTPKITLSKYCIEFLHERGLYPINYKRYLQFKKSFIDQYDRYHYKSQVRLIDNKASCETVCGFIVIYNYFYCYSQ